MRNGWITTCFAIAAAVAVSNVAGAVSPAAEKAILKWCQYKIDAPTNITVYAAEDARRIVDEVFLPACKGDDASKRQPRIRNAADDLWDEDLVRFCWWGRKLPSVAFCPPATLTDVADFFTVAMKPCGCPDVDERTLVVAADPTVAQRKVRAFSATDIDAFDVFSRVVAAAGCRFTAEGTNVTLVADLDEAGLSVPRVADLERQLAAEKGRTVREWAETVRKEAAAKEAASEDEDDEEDDE